MAYVQGNPDQQCDDQLPPTDPNLMLPAEVQFDQNILGAEYYQTGGYLLAGTQIMNCLFQDDRIADVTFDPLEELVWCITRMGQLSAFYSTTLEGYITATIPLLINMNSSEIGSVFSELKQVCPSSRPAEHSVFVLANNGLHALDKSGRPLASAMDKLMMELECLTITGPTGSLVGTGMFSGGLWPGAGNFSRFFLGGLQPTLLEVDATERWGDVLRAIDVGVGGSVVLRPFSSGLCAGNTNGKVLIIDSRTSNGIVRELDAHTGEISDITVDAAGHTLVTCGWSRMGDSGFRVDRLLRVYDLRSGRAQIPSSALLDPCFARFIPGCNDRLLTASQTGAFQIVHWGKKSFSPNDLGQLWLSYDRLLAMDISQNGNCAIFGTETGQLQLYLNDVNVCQFNINPLPTEFASSYAESLWATNCVNIPVPTNYPLLMLEDPTTNLCGSNLIAIGKTAAESVGLQLLAGSLHQPSNLIKSDNNMMTTEFLDLVENRKNEAANKAIMVAYKPIEYDNYNFSLANVPFSSNPPPVYDTQTLTTEENSFTCMTKSDPLCSSDWPDNLISNPRKLMQPIDPDLFNNMNHKRTVRKPSHWGTVWHPYSDTHNESSENVQNQDLKLGRFENVEKTIDLPTETKG